MSGNYVLKEDVSNGSYDPVEEWQLRLLYNQYLDRRYGQFNIDGHVFQAHCVYMAMSEEYEQGFVGWIERSIDLGELVHNA